MPQIKTQEEIDVERTRHEEMQARHAANKAERKATVAKLSKRETDAQAIVKAKNDQRIADDAEFNAGAADRDAERREEREARRRQRLATYGRKAK